MNNHNLDQITWYYKFNFPSCFYHYLKLILIKHVKLNFLKYKKIIIIIRYMGEQKKWTTNQTEKIKK